MWPDEPLLLSQSLELARRALDGPLHGIARAARDFDIDLPPTDGTGATFAPGALAALGTLYLQAELEQAGIIPAVEALVAARTTVDLPSERVAELLERFSSRGRDWYDQPSRAQLFARVFGIGPGARDDGGGAVNREFEQLLAALCAALDGYARGQSGIGGVPAQDEVRVRTAAGDLLVNLELRRYGNTVFATRRIQSQLEAAIEVLKDHDVQTMFHAGGFWATLQRILAPNAPDIARLVERGQAGQRLIGWLGGAATPSDGTGGAGAALGPDAPVLRWATQWLIASGLDQATQPAGSLR